MRRAVLGALITRRTREEFGIGINPHTFRHIAATTVAEDDPDNVTAVPGLLGHATLDPSQKVYNRAKMAKAGRAYQEELIRRRARLRCRG
jgi:integrase